MITYSATLDVPRALAQRLGRLLAARRRQIGTPKGRRALSCFGQAILILRWFRDDTRLTCLARDAGISIATAYRYLHEGIDVLAATAPDLHEALRRCAREGLSHLILDGTLLDTDRVAGASETGHDLWYSGKHRRFGGNIQFLATGDGFPVWTSAVMPGSVHDLTAAREHVLPALYHAASQLNMPTLADKGYIGAGIGIHVPVKKPSGNQAHDVDTRTYNTLLVRMRCLGERAAALLLTRWKALTHITLCPWRIGDIVRAALVLTHFEHSRTH